MRGSTYTPEIARANTIERTAKINTESTYAILNRLQGQIDSIRRISNLALLIDGSNQMLANLHLNGFNLDLDVDRDTYLGTDGDDHVELVMAGASGQFDITINGADDFTFTVNSFNVLAGSVINIAAGTAQITFGDGDSYIYERADDIVAVVLAGAAGELEININGAEDFNFQANTLNVLAGSHIEMGDDTWIGFTAGGQLVWDSTPGVDEIRVVSANLDLNDNDLIIDADGDSYLHATANNQVEVWAQAARVCGAYNDVTGNQFLVTDGTEPVPSLSFFLDRDTGFYRGNRTPPGDVWIGTVIGGTEYWTFRHSPVAGIYFFCDSDLYINGNDFYIDSNTDIYLHSPAVDIVELVLVNAAGEFQININGVDDFTFAANSLNVLAGSHIEMADDTWVGFTAGAQIVFDSTPATDLISLNNCTVTFGTYGLGIIHSSAGGALTSSAIVNADFGSLGTLGVIPRFAATGFADSVLSQDAFGIRLATTNELFIPATEAGTYDGLFIGDSLRNIYAGLQALQTVAGNYLYFANGRRFAKISGWADTTGGVYPGGMFLVLGNTFNFSSFAVGSITPVERMSVNTSGYAGFNVINAIQESPIQYGNRNANDVIDSPPPLVNIIGDPNDTNSQRMLRLMRAGRLTGNIQVNATADFNLYSWGAGGPGDSYRGRAKLDINLKNDTSGYDWMETADETILSLYSDGRVAMPTDSANFLIGAGLDAGIQYDGTNLLITPDLVGTGKVIINTAQAVALTIGNGSAGIDYQITINGESNDLTLTYMEDEDFLKTSSVIRGATSLYRRYYHINMTENNPGASGATWVNPGADSVGGWQLNAASETLNAIVDVHSDWDGATDMIVELYWEVNIDNTGGAAGDTVDLKCIAYYKGLTEVVTKSQTVEEPTTVGASARYKQFKTEFTLDWDAVSNVIEAGDTIHLVFNLETDTSEVDDIIVNHGTFYYQTTHIGIESGDV